MHDHIAQTLDGAAELVGSEQCWLPRSARSPWFARRLLRDLLTRVKDGERFLDKGELVLSELATNAVLHGTRAGQLIRVGLEVDHERLTVTVEDASAAVPQLCHAAEGESGRGMVMVDRLSRRWGYGPRQGVGKRVWAEIAPEEEVSG